jgi:hypothetical protein
MSSVKKSSEKAFVYSSNEGIGASGKYGSPNIDFVRFDLANHSYIIGRSVSTALLKCILNSGY